MNKILNKYKGIDITFDLNYAKIPCNIIPMSPEGVNEFNKIVEYLHNEEYNKITRSYSGGISISLANFMPPMYDVRQLKSCIEITIVDIKCYRIQFRTQFSEMGKTAISGKTAFLTFEKELRDTGIKISDYAINNGMEIKKSIPKQKRELNDDYEKMIIDNVHHIDFHSAYMSGVAISFPEFYPAIKKIYDKRKIDPICKGVLTNSWGYMQSEIIKAKYAHISKCGIEWTNKKLGELARKIIANKGKIIAFNADGVWYRGDIYHGEDEGPNLGQWENDYTNCSVYFDSIASYYIIMEDGTTKVRASGKYNLDKIKPREDWTLDDFLNRGNSIMYSYNSQDERISIKNG